MAQAAPEFRHPRLHCISTSEFPARPVRSSQSRKNLFLWEHYLVGVREAEENKEHDHATSCCSSIGGGLCRRFHAWICARSGFWHGARNWWGCI
jgi:hypothetical protein